jgi:hypothetical protein
MVVLLLGAGLPAFLSVHSTILPTQGTCRHYHGTFLKSNSELMGNNT